MTQGFTRLSAEATWNTIAPGIERRLLRGHTDGGGTYVLRFAANARFPSHTHPGGEDLYVMSGQVTVSGRTLSAGDYLWTPGGGTNAVHALSPSELLVIAPRGVELESGAGR